MSQHIMSREVRVVAKRRRGRGIKRGQRMHFIGRLKVLEGEIRFVVPKCRKRKDGY